ncbi:hypothetical protein IHV25_05085 [Phaeovibrio sulfidiphilus]|uniref:Uncharacterized protein n=1 Tax=Phaeovibrio sulfidiphilus TaxID=1220600 RepID=A0A8J6YLW9_9PROT|nr:competence protein ComJ [Phaeovibrio sulfidiphilus]MBE1237018.1 hypothetical protein [Phaeovibrio sulfidiphilus]
MTTERLEITAPIFDGQFIVSNAEKYVFMTWTREHIAQGFVWSRDNVALAIPSHMAGDFRIGVNTTATERVVRPDAFRAIVVPFHAGPRGVALRNFDYNLVTLDLPEGSYELLWQLSLPETREPSTVALRLDFSFVRTDTPRFGILRRDREISASHVLTTEGHNVAVSLLERINTLPLEALRPEELREIKELKKNLMF